MLRDRLLLRRLAAGAAVALWAALSPVAADRVTRHDGSTMEGTVVSVDAEALILEVGGERRRVPRNEISEIRFAREAPPVRVEIRNIDSDDALDVLLGDEVVLREGRRGGEWIDLTPRLKDGNNGLRFRIHNARGTWAYRVALRVNGETRILSCGTPRRTDAPCDDFGHSGIETGVIDDLPTLWIHVDRGIGRVEVLP